MRGDRAPAEWHDRLLGIHPASIHYESVTTMITDILVGSALPLAILLILGLFFVLDSLWANILQFIGRFTFFGPWVVVIAIAAALLSIIRVALIWDRPKPYQHPSARYVRDGVVEVTGDIDDLMRNIHFACYCDSATRIGHKTWLLTLPTCTDQETKQIAESINMYGRN